MTVQVQVAARLDALHAAVAGLRELNHAALDPAARCQTLQSLETAQRLQTVLSHDIIHSLTFDIGEHYLAERTDLSRRWGDVLTLQPTL